MERSNRVLDDPTQIVDTHYDAAGDNHQSGDDPIEEAAEILGGALFAVAVQIVGLDNDGPKDTDSP